MFQYGFQRTDVVATARVIADPRVGWLTMSRTQGQARVLESNQLIDN